jgi:hypothetical protein
MNSVQLKVRDAMTDHGSESQLQIINQWLSDRLAQGNNDKIEPIAELQNRFIVSALAPIKSALGLGMEGRLLITVRSSFCGNTDYIRPVFSQPRSLTEYLRNNQNPFKLPRRGAFVGVDHSVPSNDAELDSNSLFLASHRIIEPADVKDRNECFSCRVYDFLSQVKSKARAAVLRETAAEATHVFFAGRTRPGGDASHLRLAHLLALYYRRASHLPEIDETQLTSLLEQVKHLFDGLDLIAQIDAQLFEADGLKLVTELLPEYARDDVAFADKVSFTIERLKLLFKGHMIGRHGSDNAKYADPNKLKMEQLVEGRDSMDPSIKTSGVEDTDSKIFYLAASFEKGKVQDGLATVTPRLRLYPQCYSTDPELMKVAYRVAHRNIRNSTELLLWYYLQKTRITATSLRALNQVEKTEIEEVKLADDFRHAYEPKDVATQEMQICFPTADCLTLSRSLSPEHLWEPYQHSTSDAVKSIAAFVIEGNLLHEHGATPNSPSFRYLPRGVIAIESPFEDGFSDSDIESLRRVVSGIASLIRTISHHHSPIDYRLQIPQTYMNVYYGAWRNPSKFKEKAVFPETLEKEATITEEHLKNRIQRFLFFTQKIDGSVLIDVVKMAKKNPAEWNVSEKTIKLVSALTRRNKENWKPKNEHPNPRERGEILTRRMNDVLDFLRSLFDKPGKQDFLQLLSDDSLHFLEAVPENFTWCSYLTCLSQILGDRLTPGSDTLILSRMMPGFSASGMFIARISGQLRQIVKLSSAKKVAQELENYRKWVRYRLINAAKIPVSAFAFETMGHLGRQHGLAKKMAFSFKDVAEDADGILVSDLVSGEFDSKSKIRTLLDSIALAVLSHKASGGADDPFKDIPPLDEILSHIRDVFGEYSQLWRKDVVPRLATPKDHSRQLTTAACYRLLEDREKEEAEKALSSVLEAARARGAVVGPLELDKLSDINGRDDTLPEIEAGIIHGDLNARNLTWSQGLRAFFLIDFEHTDIGLRGADQFRLCVNIIVELVSAATALCDNRLEERDHVILCENLIEAEKMLCSFQKELFVAGQNVSGKTIVLAVDTSGKAGPLTKIIHCILKTVFEFEPGGDKSAFNLLWSEMLLIAALKEACYASRNVDEGSRSRMLKVDWLFSENSLSSEIIFKSSEQDQPDIGYKPEEIRYAIAVRLLYRLVSTSYPYIKAKLNK